MIYRIDPTWWRHTHPRGETVVAGTPVRIFRLTPSASTFLDQLEAGDDVDATTGSLQVRLVEAGAIHPIPDVGMSSPPTLDDVTVVIPAHVHDVNVVRNLVASLPNVADIVVVDDASPEPLDGIARARIVRNDVALGPAAARNTALREVRTEFVLFVDHDITCPADMEASNCAASNCATSNSRTSTSETRTFWHSLLFHMRDPRTAIVAPRVMSKPGTTSLERYEVENSPLDMGSQPARVAPGSRLSYVPSAALLVRMQSLRDLGGFDQTLRYGEDVDLIWRAHEAGLTCRYEPSVVLFHDPRSNWSSLLRQRFHYGTAAAHLEERHPGATRPVRMNTWSAVAVSLAFSGHPVVAAGVAASTVARLARRLHDVPDRWVLAWRIAGRGHLFAVRTTLEAASRTWWPITVSACAVSKRLRRIFALYVLIRSIEPMVPRRARGSQQRVRSLDPVRSAVAKIGDDVAYGAGVWAGAMSTRKSDCLRPRFD
ncbi:MAG: glycosyltransferase [Actinomycetota bacterium]